MFFKKKEIFCFSMLLGLILLTGCYRSVRMTITDIALINESKYPLLVIQDPSGQLNKELTFTSFYIPPNESAFLHLAEETEKGIRPDQWNIRKYNSMHYLYVLPEDVLLDITIKVEHKLLINEKELQALLQSYPPVKIYSRSELENIAMGNKELRFWLYCILDDSLHVTCEPTGYLIKTTPILKY